MSELSKIAKKLVSPKKGILAADQSPGSAGKLLAIAGVDNTPINRGLYRRILFTAPEVEQFISGVILYEETLYQKIKSGVLYPELLAKRGMIPGIKVDQGKVPMPTSSRETITQGIDGLRERLEEHKKTGVKFAKWRSAFVIGDGLPSTTCIESNSELLAQYALYCQEAGLVPIVEPEVLMTGKHSFDKSRVVNTQVLKTVFIELEKHGVKYNEMLLKPSWIHQGFDNPEKSTSEEIAKATLQVFRHVLPDDLPGVVFLSGGDTPEDSCDHLDAINEYAKKLDSGVPWELSFSFGRALQEPVLKAWMGKKENVVKAQKVLYERAKLNSLAREGEY